MTNFSGQNEIQNILISYESTHAHRLPRFQTLNGLWDLMAKRSCYAVAPILLLLEWAMQGTRAANRSGFNVPWSHRVYVYTLADGNGDEG